MAACLLTGLFHNEPNEDQQAEHHRLVHGDPKSCSLFQPKIAVLGGAELPDQPPQDPLVKLALFLLEQLLLVHSLRGVDAAGDKLLLGHVGLRAAIVVDPVGELPIVGLVVPVALRSKVDIQLPALLDEGSRAHLHLHPLGLCDWGATRQGLPVPFDSVLYASCLDCSELAEEQDADNGQPASTQVLPHCVRICNSKGWGSSLLQWGLPAPLPPPMFRF